MGIRQKQLMRMMHRRGAMTAPQAAEHLGMPQATANYALRALMWSGFTSRTPADPSTRQGRGRLADTYALTEQGTEWAATDRINRGLKAIKGQS